MLKCVKIQREARNNRVLTPTIALEPCAAAYILGSVSLAQTGRWSDAMLASGL